MDSEDTYHYKSRPALEVLKLQAEEHLAEFAPLEGDQPGQPNVMTLPLTRPNIKARNPCETLGLYSRLTKLKFDPIKINFQDKFAVALDNG